MIVEGSEVTQEAIDKATVWACTQIHFTCGELQAQLIRARVNQDTAYRAADRLLQKWKKDAKIIFRKSQWHWQGEAK